MTLSERDVADEIEQMKEDALNQVVTDEDRDAGLADEDW